MHKIQSVPPVYQGYAQPTPLHFYFYEDISDPENYCELVHSLDHAADGDLICLHLATDGGVASAGTIIFLACHEHVIAPFSHFLFHDGSYGSMGMKFNESLKQANAISELYASLAYSVYGAFFDDIEIERILEGVDCYLTSTDMTIRIQRAVDDMGAMSDENEETKLD